MKQRLVFVFILLANARVCYSSYLNSKSLTLTTDAHDLIISANDNFTVYALDDYKMYFLHLLSGRIDADCGRQYLHPEFYVYSLSAMTMRNNSSISFVQIAENTTSNEAVLSVITINSFSCADLIKPEKVSDTIVWSGGHQEYMSIKIDPQEKFAYVFADSFVLSYDLSKNMVNQFVETTNGTFWNDNQVTIRSFDLTNEWALVAGYSPYWKTKSRSICRAILLQLRPFRYISSEYINDDTVSTAETQVYNREYDLSVSLDSSGLFAAIGAPRLNRVVLVQISEYFLRKVDNELGLRLNQFALYASISSGIFGYGRSVAWLDDQGTLAVLVERSKNQVWSTSEVRVYSNIAYSSQIIDAIPDFVFPNNQQTLGSYLNTIKPGFIQILSRRNNLLVLTDEKWMLYIPSVGPGQNAVLLIHRTDLFTYVFEAKSCLSGTYKNKTSIGPCTICPSQTKNPSNGTSLITECLPCKKTSFCPLGATDDVNLDNFSSYIQTFAYPNSPDTDSFDDLLLLNLFTIRNKARCIPYSPLFWTIFGLVCCVLMWISMYFLKIYERRGVVSLGSHRKRAKMFLKHMDVIFEGERWIGGLFSFVVFVIIGLTSWFAIFYLHLYPIEMSYDLRDSCQADQYNSDFDNGLQLPLLNPNGSHWAIFDMLDSQPFILSVDLINSPIQCTDIRIQQNRRSVLPISIPTGNCTVSSNNVTVNFNFTLPGHRTIVQIDIIGPYFIGAVRFCLHGPPSIDNEVNNLHELDACTLFYTSNQTISQSTDFTVTLIKVVNITKSLEMGAADMYDGRWAPTISSDSLSDKLFLEQNGQYIRYISDRTTFTIEFTEESYFLQNNQEPIIRSAALSFHTLLFISLIIQMFATIFLIHRMCCQPLFRIGHVLILTSRKKHKDQLEMINRKNHVS